MPKADAAAALGVRQTIIPELVRAGHLDALPPQPGVLSGICPTSLERFQAEYVVASRYAEAIGISSLRVYAALDFAGIRSLPLAGQISCRFVRPRDVAQLGPEWSLDGLVGATESRLWRAIVDHIATVGSTNRLIAGGGGHAKLRAGEGKFSAHIDFSATKSTVVLTLATDAKVSPARYSKVLDRLDLFRTVWPKARIDINSARSEVILSETFRFGPGALSDEAASDLARVLDTRATMIRGLLREQPPEAIFDCVAA